MALQYKRNSDIIQSMDELTISEKIKIILKRKGMTARELAEKLDTTPQNLQNKLARDNFKFNDIVEIAEALGVRFVYDFVDDEKRGA